MEEYEILLKDHEIEKELILFLNDTELDELIEELNLIDLNGGQFTWGYNKKSNPGRIVISFQKVKLTIEGKIVGDDRGHFLDKLMLKVIVDIILACIGLYCFFYYITRAGQ
jgi:hypothetical protein